MRIGRLCCKSPNSLQLLVIAPFFCKSQSRCWAGYGDDLNLLNSFTAMMQYIESQNHRYLRIELDKQREVRMQMHLAFAASQLSPPGSQQLRGCKLPGPSAGVSHAHAAGGHAGDRRPPSGLLHLLPAATQAAPG